MSTLELKEMLIEKINGTDDEELLEEIAHLLDVELETTNGVYKMSAEQLAAVNEGLEQLKNGEWLSHEDAEREIDEWLNE